MAANQQRLYYLDWLRILVVLGVFVVHWLLPFTGGRWIIANSDLNLIAAVVVLLGNQVGMPLLFLISGISTGFSRRRRSAAKFVRERFNRLILPYLFAVFTLTWLQEYVSDRHYGRFDGPLLDYLPRYFRLEPFTSWDFRFVGYYGSHLWFLGFLFIYALLTLPLFGWLATRGRPIIDWLGRIVERQWGLLLLGLPIVLTQLLLRQPFPRYRSWADFAFWGSFFLIGYIFYMDERFLRAIRRSGRMLFISFLVSLVAMFGVALFSIFSFEDTATLTGAVDIVANLPFFNVTISLITFNSWLAVLLTLWLGMRFFDRTGPRFEYMSDAALPIYLLHQPIIVLVGFYVVLWDVGLWAKAIWLGVLSVLLTFSIYHFLVRPNHLLRGLLGLRPLRDRGSDFQRYTQLAAGGVALAFLAGFVIVQEPADVPPPWHRVPPEWITIYPGEEFVCADGSPYHFYLREQRRAQDLLIYFQSGGLCWNALTCGFGSPTYESAIAASPFGDYGGLFDFDNPENPALAFDFAFLPNCTGDLHAGAQSVIYTDLFGNDIVINHYGYLNATAALDWIYGRFPSPRRVVMTGTEAGGFGALLHAPAVATRYADVPITVLADSPLGNMLAGWEGYEQWAIFSNVPGPDPAAFTIADLFLYAGQSENIRLAQIGSSTDPALIYYDVVMGNDVLDWQERLFEQVETVSQQALNYTAFIADRTGQATLNDDVFYDVEEEGIRLRDWFADVIAGRQPGAVGP